MLGGMKGCYGTVVRKGMGRMHYPASPADPGRTCA